MPDFTIINPGPIIRYKKATKSTFATAFTGTISANTYGRSIPISRGKRLIEGQLLWSTAIKVETKTTKTTWKGHEEYTFLSYDETAGKSEEEPEPITEVEVTRMYVDCAIGFGRPLNSSVTPKILQIRAGNSIIYDKTKKGTKALKTGGMTLYPGSRTQTPDKLMEKYLGVGKVPAYRDEIYIVFKELDLLQFGGSFPTLSIVVADSSVAVSEGVQNLSATNITANLLAIDHSRGLLYAGLNSSDYIYRVDLRRLIPVGNFRALNGLNGNSIECAEWYNLIIHSGNSNIIYAIDATTGAQKGSSFGGGSVINFDNVGFQTPQLIIAQIVSTSSGPVVYVVVNGIVGGTGLLLLQENGTLTYQGHSGAYGRADTGCRGGAGKVFLASGKLIHRINIIEGLEERELDANGFLELPGDFAWLDLNDAIGDDDGFDFNIIAINALHYVSIDDTIIALCEMTPDANDNRGIAVKINSKKKIIWAVKIFRAGDASGNRGKESSKIETLYWEDSNIIYALNVISGSYQVLGSTGTFDIDGSAIYDDFSGALIGRDDANGDKLSAVFASSLTGQRFDLADLLRELGLFVGFELAEIYVDPAIIDQIDGFCLVNSAQTNFWTLGKNIGQAFLFSMTEGSGTIAFKKRVKIGDEDVIHFELAQDDLALLSPADFPRNTGDSFSNAAIITNIRDDAELFDYVEMIYSDPLMDYQQNTQYQSRARLPSDDFYTGKRLSLNIEEIIISTNEAATLCANILFNNLASKMDHNFRLKTKSLKAEPGDIVNITLNDLAYRIQLDQITYHMDFSLTCIGEDYLYDPEPIERDGQPPKPPDIPPVPDNASQIIVLDIPTLSGNQSKITSTANISVYYGVSSFGQDGWLRATSLKSIDNVVYTKIDEVTEELIVGRCSTALASDTYSVDEVTILDFFLENGDDALLKSVSNFNWQIGVNLAIIGNPGNFEIVSIRNIVPLGNRQFRATGFYRGLRDTYMHRDSHVDGERIVFPALGGLSFDAEPRVSGLNAMRRYKAVGAGEDALATPTQLVTLTGEAQRPFTTLAHRAIKNTGNNDIIINWKRQSRLSVPFVDSGFEQSKLEFATQEYTITIYDGISGNIVQTANVLGSNSYTYLAADQLADGFVVPISRLVLKVEQLGQGLIGRSIIKSVMVERVL